MKGEQLEGIRFRHPLYERDSVGVLGDYVTLEQGTGAVHTAPGHGADDFLTGMKYGLEIYAPVGPGGHFLDTVELFGGQRVFDANPNVEQALQERGRLWHRETFSHQYPHCWRCHNPVIFLATSQWFVRMDGDPVIAGEDGQTRTLREAARHAIDHEVKWIPRLGPRPHLQHGVEPAGLVHLAPARVGRADPGGRLHGVRRSGPHAGADRPGGGGLRAVQRRRLVRAADRGVPPAGSDLPVVRRHRRSSASATSSTSGSTRARATRRCCRATPELTLAVGHVPRGQRPASRLVPELAARGAGHARPAAVPRGADARLPDRPRRPEDVEVARQRHRRRRTSSRRAAPRSSGCGWR